MGSSVILAIIIRRAADPRLESRRIADIERVVGLGRVEARQSIDTGQNAFL